MARAIRTGDRSLAHAIYRRALDAHWTTVAGMFTKENPTLAEVGRDLQTIKTALEDSLARTMYYAGTYGL